MKKIALILSLMVGFSIVASANTAQQASPSNQTAASVSESDLNKFAKAHQAIFQILQKYQGKLQASQKKEDVQKLQQQAFQEMKQVVESNGLSPQQYSQIGQIIQQSPELQEKLKKLQ